MNVTGVGVIVAIGVKQREIYNDVDLLIKAAIIIAAATMKATIRDTTYFDLLYDEGLLV